MDITTSGNWTYLKEMSTNSTVNETSFNSTVHRNESLARAEIFVQSVILVLAVLGNGIVLTALFMRRATLTRMHVLMIHLSLADMFVAFCSVLPQLAWDVTFVFKGGDFLCRLVKYMQIVAIYASSYVLLTTALDRYFAICHPLLSHKWPSSMVHMLVLAAWGLSLVFSVPQIFIFISYQVNSLGLPDCWATFDPPWTMPLYITSFTCLVYIIPTLILVYCYSNICLAVWRSGDIVAIYASSYVLLTTALDRYFAICHPLLSHKWPSSMVHMLVLAAWGLSLVFSVPQIFIFSYQVNSLGLPDCWATFDPPWTMPLYITSFTCLVYIIPTLILVYCYSNICLAVWRSGKADMKHGAKVLKNMVPVETTVSLIRATTHHDNKTFTTDVHTANNSDARRSSTSGKYGTNTFRKSVNNKNVNEIHRDISVDESDNNSATESLERLDNIHERRPCNNNSCNGSSRRGFSLKHFTLTRGKRVTHNHGECERMSPVNCGARRSNSSGISRAKMKTIKLTMTVVICYLACWSPFFIAQMWAVYDVNAPFDGSAYTIILLLASLNSCTNPWIYLIYSDIVFSGFKELFAKCK